MVLPTSDCDNVIDDPVSPLLHVYVMDPNPSSSANVFEAVNVSPSSASPVIVTLPVGLSLTLLIEKVTVVASLVLPAASEAVTVKLYEDFVS